MAKTSYNYFCTLKSVFGHSLKTNYFIKNLICKECLTI